MIYAQEKYTENTGKATRTYCNYCYWGEEQTHGGLLSYRNADRIGVVSVVSVSKYIVIINTLHRELKHAQAAATHCGRKYYHTEHGVEMRGATTD